MTYIPFILHYQHLTNPFSVILSLQILYFATQFELSKSLCIGREGVAYVAWWRRQRTNLASVTGCLL
jgi:hypothetical protein